MEGYLLRGPVALMYVMLTASVASQSMGSMGCSSPPTSYGITHNGEHTKYAVGSAITYTCSFGYVSVGNTTRTCTANGTWTGTDNVCRIDLSSLVLACFAGAVAIFIFLVASCFLICRSRQRRLRAERRLTIQREGGKPAEPDEPEATAVPTGEYTEAPLYAQTQRKPKDRAERSDSGLQTDMDDVELNDFSMTVDSPTDNNILHTETDWEHPITE